MKYLKIKRNVLIRSNDLTLSMNQPKQIQDKIVVVNKNISWVVSEDLSSRYLINCFLWSVQSVTFGDFNFSEGNVPSVSKWLLTSIRSNKLQFQLQIPFKVLTWKYKTCTQVYTSTIFKQYNKNVLFSRNQKYIICSKEADLLTSFLDISPAKSTIYENPYFVDFSILLYCVSLMFK